MNYRHAYHAGNFADVLKHAVLALVIEHLKQKPSPFRVIDTHAGIGLYDLGGEHAEKTGEWKDGIGRIFGADLPRRRGRDPGALSVRHSGRESGRESSSAIRAVLSSRAVSCAAATR